VIVCTDRHKVVRRLIEKSRQEQAAEDSASSLSRPGHINLDDWPCRCEAQVVSNATTLPNLSFSDDLRPRAREERCQELTCMASTAACHTVAWRLNILVWVGLRSLLVHGARERKVARPYRVQTLTISPRLAAGNGTEKNVYGQSSVRGYHRRLLHLLAAISASSTGVYRSFEKYQHT